MTKKIKQSVYLLGYKEGFESALKIAWAYAEEMSRKVDEKNKEVVTEYINKLKN